MKPRAAAVLCAVILWAPAAVVALNASPARAAGSVTRAADGAAQADRSTSLATHYRGFTPYSSFRHILWSVAMRSARVRSLIRVGYSAGGRPLWNIVLTAPMNRKAWRINQRFRQALLTDPDQAGAILAATYTGTGMGARVPGSRVVRPVLFLNCSIHGDEPTGADAGLKLIRRLAFGNDAATRRWLRSAIVVVDPVQNPDGRVTDRRVNANGYDCNRDFITLTQPEDVITSGTLRTWVPETMLDLHSTMNPLLCEPCTIPHNPNLEFDLTYKWEVPLGAYMTRRFRQTTGRVAQIPFWWGTSRGATGSVNEGWDDYGPYYTAMLAQEYGAAAFTVETDSAIAWGGVQGHYVMSTAGLDYTSRHGAAMLRDHVAYMQRGADQVNAGRPWQGNVNQDVRASVFDPITGAAPIRELAWGQPGFPYSNTVGDITFPFAYVVPVDAAHQRNVYEAYKALNHAAWYGIRILRATAPFTADGVAYPAGAFIVPMHQALRGLANNLFWDGEDVKAKYGVSSMYDISAWSLKYAYGISAPAVTTPFQLPATEPVADATPALVRTRAGSRGDGPAGLDPVPYSVTRCGAVGGAGGVYWWSGDSILAARLANECLRRGLPTGLATRPIAAPYDAVPLDAFVVDVSGTPAALGWLAGRAHGWGVDLTAALGLRLAQVSRLAVPGVVLNTADNAGFVVRRMLDFQNVKRVARTAGGAAAAPAAGADFYYSTNSGDSAAAVSRWLAGSSAARVRTWWIAQAADSQATFSSLWGSRATYTIDAIAAGPAGATIHVTVPTALQTGDYVALSHTNSLPALDRTLPVTVLDPRTFTVPDRINRSGTSGTVTVPCVAVAGDRSAADNGFMATSYAGDDVLTSGCATDGCSFAYPPSWYHVNTGGAFTPQIEATFSQGSAGSFLQGFWNYECPDAVGSAAMISVTGTTASPAGRVIASGFNPTYRGYQDNTALLLARAIFLSRCTPPSQP